MEIARKIVSKAKELLFLCSGGGGTLKFAHSIVKRNYLGFEKISIIADRECGAYKWGLENNISTKLIRMKSKDQHELINECKKHQNAIIITNIHKILEKEFFDEIKNQKINVHYSMLPSFKGTIGMDTLQNAIEYGVTIVGATCHLVNEEVDSGRPLAQVVYCLNKKDSNEDAMNNMFRAGCLSLTNALKYIDGESYMQVDKSTILINKKEFMVSPNYGIPEDLKKESFWQEIK